MNPEIEINKNLQKTARKINVFDFLDFLLMALSYSLIVHLVFVSIDHYFLVGKLVRWFSFLLLILPSLITFCVFFKIRLSRKLNYIFIAQCIEKENKHLKNALINYVLSEKKDSLIGQKLVDDMQQIKIRSLSVPPSILRLVKGVSFCLFLMILYFIASVQSIPLSLSRLYLPWVDFPLPSKTIIVKMEPKNGAFLDVDSNWEIKVTSVGITPEKGMVSYRNFGEQWTTVELTKSKDQKNVFFTEMPHIRKSLEYYVKLGDALTLVRRIKARRKPIISSFSVKYINPEYLKQKNKKLNQQNILGLRGTRIKINIFFDQKIEFASLNWRGYTSNLKISKSKQLIYNKNSLVLEENGEYFFTYKGFGTDEIIVSPKYQISVVKDKPPTVFLLRPEKNLNVKYDDKVTFSYKAEDDWSLEKAYLQFEFRYRETKKKIDLPITALSRYTDGMIILDLRKELNLIGGEYIQCYLVAEDSQPNNRGKSISDSIILKVAETAKSLPMLFAKGEQENKKYGRERKFKKIEQEEKKKKKDGEEKKNKKDDDEKNKKDDDVGKDEKKGDDKKGEKKDKNGKDKGKDGDLKNKKKDDDGKNDKNGGGEENKKKGNDEKNNDDGKDDKNGGGEENKKKGNDDKNNDDGKDGKKDGDGKDEKNNDDGKDSKKDGDGKDKKKGNDGKSGDGKDKKKNNDGKKGKKDGDGKDKKKNNDGKKGKKDGDGKDKKKGNDKKDSKKDGNGKDTKKKSENKGKGKTYKKSQDIAKYDELKKEKKEKINDIESKGSGEINSNKDSENKLVNGMSDSIKDTKLRMKKTTEKNDLSNIKKVQDIGEIDDLKKEKEETLEKTNIDNKSLYKQKVSSIQGKEEKLEQKEDKTDFNHKQISEENQEIIRNFKEELRKLKSLKK